MDRGIPGRAVIRKLLNLRTLAVLVAVAALAAIGWFWYRSSSLVKIKHVTVVGLSGPQVPQIRAALKQSALTMTTLNLSLTKLESSVQGYSVVSFLSAQTHGSHAVTIDVYEKIPVATVAGDYVDGAGRVLPASTAVHGHLPALKLSGATAPVTVSGEVTGRDAHAILKVLAAAPYAFLAHLQSATHTAANGVVLQITNGPELYFGSTAKLKAKWPAALAVLRSSDSAGAGYINVTDPQRPAAGA